MGCPMRMTDFLVAVIAALVRTVAALVMIVAALGRTVAALATTVAALAITVAALVMTVAALVMTVAALVINCSSCCDQLGSKIRGLCGNGCSWFKAKHHHNTGSEDGRFDT